MALLISIFLILSLLSACGGESIAADGSAPVTLEFDSHAYPHTNDRNYYVGLVYASNSSDKPVEASFKYKVYDADGNALQAFDQFRGGYREQFSSSVYIPAGAENMPIGFLLASGLIYDMNTGEDMPPVDHIEYEFTKWREETTEDLRPHFTQGEYYIKNNDLYWPISFDQEISDNYSSIYADYTILAYSDGEVVVVCCRNDYPYGGSSWNVSYAKENNDGVFNAYHYAPYNIPIDNWEIYLGCFSGIK